MYFGLLVEKVTVLRKSAEARGRREALGSGPLASKMVEYATLLTSQASQELALKYLADSNQKPRGIVPRSRLSQDQFVVQFL